MRLQTLRLHGFKSFADHTTLEFREGVTAIIGSNGCGKSNIADAIRWVLGEQRASVMRGAKMEEVIFQGTARRRAVNLAEVSLHFDNKSGRIAIPQTELEVSRKVFREGGSEYSLNKNACRLRDVQGLLRDTGLGSNAYAVIESTMIETLLSDRAEERRALFEEAAGIGKYKDSRRAATRRLESAEADLTRLDDLIAEVESKVRSLGRQKRKAERYSELRARRLDLEIAIAREELASLEAELRTAASRRSEVDESNRVAGVEKSTTEAVLEERRIEAADLGRRRVEVAGRLEAVRRELDARERDVLLAEERRSHAEQRLLQLSREKSELQERVRRLRENISRAAEEVAAAAELVEAARHRAEEKVQENDAIRKVLSSERSASEDASVRARELARKIATAEGDRAAAERQVREAGQRMGELEEQLGRIRLELTQMSDQTELWETQAEEFRERADRSRELAELAREQVMVLRGRAQRARDEAREADDRVSKLTAQVEARQALEQSYEGFSPAVAALMARRTEFPGVLGPLADYQGRSEDEATTRAIEIYLGPLLQALVVEDLATARAIRSWFRREWTEGGSLLLLPLESLRANSQVDHSRDAAGEAWVETLLHDLVVVHEDALARVEPGRARVATTGELIDAQGIVRLRDASEGQGILARREALERLKANLSAAVLESEDRLAARDALRESLAEAEDQALEAEEEHRIAVAQLKGIESDAAAHRNRRQRLQEERESADANLTRLRAAAEGAQEQVRRLEQTLAELSTAVQDAAAAEDSARARLLELENRWDAARDEEGELKVQLARAEADHREAVNRQESARSSLAAADARNSAIEREADEIRRNLEGLAQVRESASTDIESLFESRDRETASLAILDTRIAEVDSELAELAERARVVGRRETEAAEERHKLDLRVSECRSRIERVRERLEVEWGRPWSVLEGEAKPVSEGDADSWRQELRATTEQLDNLGPVNMLAVEEHEEEDRRLTFLLEQRKDLVEARENLVAAIRQINRTAREVFQSTFETVRDNFRRTFQSLFQGGECDIWLTDADDPLESAIEIQASPVGKRTQRIHLLSGGERTLTALALLFALYLVKPSPFCVLDEIDAPLDESNVGRFIQLLNDFKTETQFIVITHNPVTMEAADWVYGVTMEEPGVSSIVGVELLGAWAKEQQVAAPNA